MVSLIEKPAAISVGALASQGSTTTDPAPWLRHLTLTANLHALGYEDQVSVDFPAMEIQKS